MDRRNFLKNSLWTLAAGSAGFVWGGLANNLFPKWKKERLREHIEGIRENMVTFNTSAKIWVGYPMFGYDNFEPKVKGEGLIYDDYILTANHVVNNSREMFIHGMKPEITKSPFFDPSELTFEIISETVLLNDNKIERIVSIPDMDIAFIPYTQKEGDKSNYEVKLGDSDSLKIFDELYILGRPFSEFPVTKKGIVGALNYQKSILEDGGIITSHRAIGGDSGSPLINKDGEVVGIVSSIIQESHTLSIPINLYKEEITKYERMSYENLL